jgi:hypothetical protein
MQEDVKKPRLRSPAYPAISLKEAIERVKALYDQDKTAVVPLETAAKHIGFAKAHGQAVMFLSALRKFGLVEYPSDGRVAITRRAVDIITFPDGHSRKSKAVQDAALSPTIYSGLVEKYRHSGLPSDEAIGAELIADSGFNPTAVGAFLKDFRESLEYAGLLPNGVLPLSRSNEATTDNGASGGEQPQSQQDPAPDLFSPASNQSHHPAPPTPGVKLMEGERELTTGLLSKTARFRLLVSGDVGEKEIERLIAKLVLDKEILADPGNGGKSDE